MAGLVVAGAAYAVAAVAMVRAGRMELSAYVPLFLAATVLLVIVMIVGHALAALGGDRQDERDAQISWRAGSRAGQFLGFGAMLAVLLLGVGVSTLWVAHGLLAFVFLAEALRCVLSLIAYRRGF